MDLFRQTALVKIDRGSGKIMGKDAGTVRATVPVLKHEIIWTKSDQKSTKRLGVLSIHPSVIDVVESTASNSFFARSYPMVYPPMEWSSPSRGGYLSIPSRVLRCSDQLDPIRSVRQADKDGQLDRVYDALTILGRTPW